jgi:hypothetical protein
MQRRWVRYLGAALAGLAIVCAQPGPARAGLSACFAIPGDIINEGISAAETAGTLVEDSCEGVISGVQTAALFVAISAVVTTLDAADTFGGYDAGSCKAAIQHDIANAVAAVLLDAAGHPSDPLSGLAQGLATLIQNNPDDVFDALSYIMASVLDGTPLTTLLDCACDVASGVITQAKDLLKDTTDAAACLSGVGAVIAGVANAIGDVIADGADAIGNYIECGISTCLIGGVQNPASAYCMNISCAPGMSVADCSETVIQQTGYGVCAAGNRCQYGNPDSDGYCPCPSGSVHEGNSCACPSTNDGYSYAEIDGRSCAQQVVATNQLIGFACVQSGGGTQGNAVCCPGGQKAQGTDSGIVCSPACQSGFVTAGDPAQCQLCPAGTQVSYAADPDVSSLGVCAACPPGQTSTPGSQCNFLQAFSIVQLPTCGQGQQVSCGNGSCICAPSCSSGAIFESGACTFCAAGQQAVYSSPQSSIGACQPCADGVTSSYGQCQYPAQSKTAMVSTCQSGEQMVCNNNNCICLTTAFNAFGLKPIVTPRQGAACRRHAQRDRTQPGFADHHHHTKAWPATQRHRAHHQ